MTETEQKASKTTRTRIIAWSIFLGATVLYLLSGNFLEADQLGYYFGRGLFYFLLLVIVLGFIGRKKPSELKDTLDLVGAVIWAGFLLFVVIHLSSKKLEVEAAKSAIREFAQTGRDVIETQKAAVDKGVAETPIIVQQQQTNITPPPSNLPHRSTPPASSAQDLFQKLNEFVKQISQRTLADQAQIASDTEKLGLETMLVPQTLTSKDGIEQNRAKIKAYSELVERRLALFRSAMSEMDQQVSTLATGRPDKFEVEFLRGYAEGKKNRVELEATMYANQKAAIAALTEMNEFMAARVGRTMTQSGQLLFQTQEELDTYNKYLMEIQQQAQIESDIQKRYQEALQQTLLNINELEKMAR